MVTVLLFAAQRKGNGGVTRRKLQCVDFLTSGGEEEQVRGAKMQPLTVLDRSGQRPVSAANLLLESSAGAKSGCGFPEADRMGCGWGIFLLMHFKKMYAVCFTTHGIRILT